MHVVCKCNDFCRGRKNMQEREGVDRFTVSIHVVSPAIAVLVT